MAAGGTDNALFRLGEDKVVRLPRRARDATALAKERVWLPRLAPGLPLAVPVPLAEGTAGESYRFAWSVYRWLGGEDVATGQVSDACELATDLARFVAALQRIDTTGGPGPGDHNVFCGEPLARRDAATRSAIAALRGLLAVDDASWLRARGWALSQAVGALSYYTVDTNPTLVREARRWLSEVLTRD